MKYLNSVLLQLEGLGRGITFTLYNALSKKAVLHSIVDINEKSRVHAKKFKVLRGGSWANRLNSVRSAYRDRASPSEYGSEIGFRCVK